MDDFDFDGLDEFDSFENERQQYEDDASVVNLTPVLEAAAAADMSRRDPNNTFLALRSIALNQPEFGAELPDIFRRPMPELMQSFAAVLDDFNDIYLQQRITPYEHTQNVLAHRHYKELLEVLHMPILNPKTGEMDYVDYSIVHKTVMNPDQIYSFANMAAQKVDFSLAIEPDDDRHIYFVSKLPEEIKTPVEREVFEKLMSDIVHTEANKNLRIEQTPLFREMTGRAISEYILQQKAQGRFFLKPGIHDYNKGLGLIRDTVSGEEVGVFESMQIVVQEALCDYYIQDVTMSIGNESTILDNADRYAFVFYNTEDNFAYTLTNVKAAASESSDLASFSLGLEPSSVSIQKDLDMTQSEMIQEASRSREQLKDLSVDDVFYPEYKEKFVSDRSAILRSSQKRAEQNKLEDLFSDIEF